MLSFFECLWPQSYRVERSAKTLPSRSSVKYNWQVKIKLLFTLSLCFLLTGCVGPAENANRANTSQANQANAANKAKDNADELALMIPLSVEPEDAVWRDETVAGQRKLTAVLLYTSANADQIAERAAAHGPKQPSSIEPAEWFPAELISQSELSTDSTALPAEAMPANDFVQAPFTEGKLTRVNGTDYFVLELFVK